MPFRVSTFCIASIWKTYSLPERRAGSPVHSSDGPRLAKAMAAGGSRSADGGRDAGLVRAGRGHHRADLENDLAWVERLAGGVRRADARAPAAHRAGVGVEQLLPGEVGDGRRAEALELGLHQVGHRPHGT